VGGFHKPWQSNLLSLRLFRAEYLSPRFFSRLADHHILETAVEVLGFAKILYLKPVISVPLDVPRMSWAIHDEEHIAFQSSA
jgi:hypothetical protein